LGIKSFGLPGICQSLPEGEPVTGDYASKPAINIPHVSLEQAGWRLYFNFGRMEQTLSWAIVGGGWQLSAGCLWVRVTDRDLTPPIDAIDFLRKKLNQKSASPKVGLLTSARLEDFVENTLSFGDLQVRTVLTVGLGNALRVGDSPGPSGRIGTINMVTQISKPLSKEAQLEAMAIQTEAKTAAMLDMKIPSYRSYTAATGTGTDCQVISSPPAHLVEKYAGKHTRLGHLIGESVYHSMTAGIQRWLDRNPHHDLVYKRKEWL